MKSKLFLLAFSLMCLVLLSCSKGEDVTPPTPQPDQVGLMLDGGVIAGFSFICFGAPCEVDTFSDYSPIYFHIDIRGESNPETVYGGKLMDGEEQKLYPMIKEYDYEKTSFIVDAYNNYLDYISENHLGSSLSAPWPCFYSAYVTGEVTLTCDKELWGETPGANLCKYFRTHKNMAYCNCLPVGIDNPRLLYTFGDVLPTSMDELFPEEVWLKGNTYWEMKTLPSEKYDELTFTLTIPLKIEHIQKAVHYQYRGFTLDSKFSERVFTASCTIKFDWSDK